MKTIWRIFSKKLHWYLSFTNLSFAIHDCLVQLAYGKIKKAYTTFYIDIDFSGKLKQHLDTLDEVKMSHNPSWHKIGNSHSSLTQFSELYENLNKS